MDSKLSEFRQVLEEHQFNSAGSVDAYLGICSHEGLTSDTLPTMTLTEFRDHLAAELAKLTDHYWVPGRWWRAVEPDGQLWAESSDADEIRGVARPTDTIQRWFMLNPNIGEWLDI